MSNADFDIGIVGGGLAGLSAAIQLGNKGHRVVLFEKNSYPFHRVCGEYISMESWDYLQRCGVDLPALGVPVIKKLQLSTATGKLLTTTLDLGGFGMSRYRLDQLLCEAARQVGVTVLEKTKVTQLQEKEGGYRIASGTDTYQVRLALGSFGKRSNLDVHWQRAFVLKKNNALNNYIGVKYHIKTDFPADTIALHHFDGGYCGVSKIEEDRYCLCYLTTAAHLQATGSIREMERSRLYRNPYLKALFEKSTFFFDTPVSISQISFDSKERVYHRVPLAGDACGMITPLCGNGMSMALHSGKLFSLLADEYLCGNRPLETLLSQYDRQWRAEFSKRLIVGRLVQRCLRHPRQANLLIGALQKMPWLTGAIIKSTHGGIF